MNGQSGQRLRAFGDDWKIYCSDGFLNGADHRLTVRVFVNNVLFFSGLKTITASRASLIIATNPVFIAIFFFDFFRWEIESPQTHGNSIQRFWGSCRNLSGKTGRNCPRYVGLGWNLYSWLRGKLGHLFVNWQGHHEGKDLASMAAVTYSCVIGAIELFYPAYLDGVTHNLTSHSMMVWRSIFYLGFFGSALGFWWYCKKIKSIAPARASVYQYCPCQRHSSCLASTQWTDHILAYSWRAHGDQWSVSNKQRGWTDSPTLYSSTRTVSTSPLSRVFLLLGHWNLCPSSTSWHFTIDRYNQQAY